MTAFLKLPNARLILFFIALLLFFSVFANNFAKASNMENLLAGYSFIALIALGQTFPIIVRGIDLSIGSIVALAAMVLFDSILIFELNGPVSILLAILAGTLAGVLNGVLIVTLNLQPFVVTLATLASYRGLVFAISGRQLYPELSTTAIRDPFVTGLDYYWDIGGWTGLDAIINLPWIPLSFPILIIFVILVHILLTKTGFGTGLRAVGGNFEAARLAGLPVKRLTVAAYALSGFFAALAACLLVARLTTTTEAVGIGMELTAIAAAVIGGASLQGGQGNALGPVIGTFLLGSILIGLTLMGISQFVQQILTGLILLLAVFYDRVRNAGGLS